MEIEAKKFDPRVFVKKRKGDIGLLLAGIVFATFLNWDVVEIIIFAVFIWSIVGPIASRYLALPALFFLSFAPILLAMKREERAEEFAIYAYYFLGMMVIRAIVEIRSGKENEQKSPKKGELADFQE